ncbi:MAG: hypothetical protein LUG99_17510 [Lachnospiraceae bacterium]|nr:hypothetical protein [Lachnospiraceae bacterium]
MNRTPRARMIPEFSNRSVTDAVITDSVKEVAKEIGITRGNYTRFETGIGTRTLRCTCQLGAAI